LLESLFGGRAGPVADWTASRSGISRSSSSTLLCMALPIILGVIAKRVRSSGWSASNLMTLLEEQRSLLPDTPGLAAALNADATRVEIDEERPTYVSAKREPTHSEPVVHTREAKSRRDNAWLWVLPLLFLIPFIGYLMSRGDDSRRTAMSTPPEVALPRAPMPEPERPVGTSGITRATPQEFGQYRIEFQTGSSRFTSESAHALREVATVLKANPQAHAAVKGYTDNAGNDEANLRLSQARATATMNELVSLGIDRSRIKAQGYGEDNPVADNATAEGRHHNRRVEIQVTNR